jgi:hypothetical protein
MEEDALGFDEPPPLTPVFSLMRELMGGLTGGVSVPVVPQQVGVEEGCVMRIIVGDGRLFHAAAGTSPNA